MRPKFVEAAVGEAGSAALLPQAVEAPVVVAEVAAVVAVEDFAADVVAASPSGNAGPPPSSASSMGEPSMTRWTPRRHLYAGEATEKPKNPPSR